MRRLGAPEDLQLVLVDYQCGGRPPGFFPSLGKNVLLTACHVELRVEEKRA